MRIDLRQLRYFLALAEELHFGRAAKRVFITQPSLSLQIAQIELALDVLLLERTNRTVKLTAAGARLLEVARDTIQRLDADLLDVQRIGRTQAQPLRIGVLSEAYKDSALVTRWLSGSLQHRGSSTFEMHVCNSTSMLAGLLDGSLDLGFVHAPVEDARFDVEVIGTEPYLLAISSTHPLADHKEVALAELSEERFLVPPARGQAQRREEVLGYCRRAGFKPKIAAALGDFAQVLEFVAAGKGVSLVPSALIGKDERVRFIKLSNPVAVLTLIAIWRRV